MTPTRPGLSRGEGPVTFFADFIWAALTCPGGERLGERLKVQVSGDAGPPSFPPLAQNFGDVHPEEEGRGRQKSQEGDERLGVDHRGTAVAAPVAPLRAVQRVGELATWGPEERIEGVRAKKGNPPYLV